MLADFIKIRVDEVTKIRISNAAAAQGLSMSDFCRMCILKEIPNVNKEFVLDELENQIQKVEKLKKLQSTVKEVTESISGVVIEKARKE